MELAATVRDRQGRPAGGFTVDDFELLDHGKPRPITLFSEMKAVHAPAGDPAVDANTPVGAQTSANAPPRYLALFFDDTHAESYGLRKYKWGRQSCLQAAFQAAPAAASRPQPGLAAPLLLTN